MERPDAFRAQIDTDLLGFANFTKAALPVQREQGSGRIVLICQGRQTWL